MNFNTKQIPKTAFDSLTNNTQLDLMKVMIPYLPPSNQSGFAMMIRMQEMQETMKFYKTFPTGINSCDLEDEKGNKGDMFSDMRPYLPQDTGGKIDGMMSMMSMMNMMKEMQPTNSPNNTNESTSNTSPFGGMDMSMIMPLFSSMMGGSSSSNSMEMMKSMLSPEQEGLFDMMSMMNDFNDNSDYEAEQQVDHSICATQLDEDESNIRNSFHEDISSDDYSHIVTVV